jgi:hypothetical protein
VSKIEFCEEPNGAKYKRGLLYSRHKLTKLCQQLEAYAKAENILPYVITSNSIKFDVHTAIKFLMEKHGLWQRVLDGQQVQMAATVDGGELAWKLTQVSAGIKLIDPHTINPLTGELLFGDSGHFKVQSRNVCYPLHVHIAKDNKQFYSDHMKPFFDDINRLEDDHPTLTFAHGADMASLQKTVVRGGAMKSKTYGCYCCNIHKDDLARPNASPCTDCVRLGLTQPCYHKPVSDENMIERLRQERDETLTEFPYLLRLPLIQRQSKIRFGTLGLVEGHADPRHIEYQARNRLERVKHERLLQSELQMRSIDPVGLSYEELRLQLQELLITEAAFALADEVVKSNNLDNAMVKLEKTIPCLLHLEKCTSEAIVGHLFHRGLQLREGSEVHTNQLVSDIETIINESLFGIPGAPSNWKFPLNEDGTMGELKFSNWRARRILEHLNDLIDCCLFERQEIEKWQIMSAEYRRTIKVSIIHCNLLHTIKFGNLHVFFSFFSCFNKKTILQMMI